MIRVLGRIGDGQLHPLNSSVESVAARAVVWRHRRAAVLSDVAAVVGGENHRLRHWDSPFAGLLAVDKEGHSTALAEAAASVGKLHAHLVFAYWKRLHGLNVEVLHTCHII